ncbi:MAG: T9SS type A sorting domain-containing protein, partial [Rubricoccaceae bacterium]|nr:T9SS type A sorting domain-containing protein [Rubricoccaceae bacterium]
PSSVSVRVFDALGREVTAAWSGALGAGRHAVPLEASSLPAGVYLVRAVTADGEVATARLTRLE